jgi:hypothetical protein
MFLRNMLQSFIEREREREKKKLPYNVIEVFFILSPRMQQSVRRHSAAMFIEVTHENFFELKALSGSLGCNFLKTTENETIKMTH